MKTIKELVGSQLTEGVDSYTIKNNKLEPFEIKKDSEEAALVCLFSCGSTSYVATKMALEENKKSWGLNAYVIYTMVVNEPADNLRFLQDAQEKLGIKVIILINSKFKGDIYNVQNKKRYISGIAGAPCTTELKWRMRKNFVSDNDIQVFGFESGEEDRMDNFAKNNPTVEISCPLICNRITKEMAFDIIVNDGIKLPESYDHFMNSNCFSGDTRYITSNGIKTFNGTMGSTVLIHNRQGWQRADVKCFGEAEIVELKLKSSNGEIEAIKTTANHSWIVPRYNNVSQGTVRKETSELVYGDRPLVNYSVPDCKLSRDGVQHGFIFGDGSIYNKQNKKQYSRAYFNECKRDIVKWFDSEPTSSGYIHGFPDEYKEMPSAELPAEYLAGFVSGIIASDGNISKTGISISNISLENINKLADICASLGMHYRINQLTRDTNYKKNHTLYTLTLSSACVPDYFILRQFHIDRIAKKTTRPKSKMVVSVKHTGVYEKVYCVQVIDGVPEFTLEGGILTGNCLGCVKGQSGYWNVVRKVDSGVFKKQGLIERKYNAAINKKYKKFTPESKKYINEWLINDGKEPLSDESIGKNIRLRVFLDQLDKNAGRYKSIKLPDCGVLCELEQGLK